ncbi:MAG: serine/threonine protein kinase [Labilithrix sp.]|nr:serine/threonine protein kinase [Labilithrix sp.]MCW5812232.1 serine/threonine protein kinase [Labilithrix sp.]
MSPSFHPPRIPVPEGSLPIQFGEVLAGKYRVDQVLGQGGMAVVLAGTHVELDAPIAIKVLLPGRAADPDAVKRFLTEARAAAKLRSENVARISDVGTTQTAAGMELPFIVMERLDGVDLATLMEAKKRLPVDEAVDFVRQAARGLAEAHALKIVHRDIKPANLFLTRSRDGAPIVKVLDFGISKTLAAVETKVERAITADKEVMGSPGFMSPEQVCADKTIDVRTDIWSLGVVLHELISGRDAFGGDALHEIFASILHAEPAPLDDDVPAEVKAIVRRCLQKDPNQRYQNVVQLIDALSHAVDRPAGVPARPPLAGRGPLVAAAAAALVVVGGTFAIIVARGHGDADVSSMPPAAALSLESAPVPAAVAPAVTTIATVTNAEGVTPPSAEPEPEPEPAAVTPPPRSSRPLARPSTSAPSTKGLPTRKRTDW